MGCNDIFGDRILEDFTILLRLNIFGAIPISSSRCGSQLEVFKMATTSIQASNLFNVNGLVAVITGGGSGAACRLNEIPKTFILTSLRNWLNDGESFGIERC